MSIKYSNYFVILFLMHLLPIIALLTLRKGGEGEKIITQRA
jgi:hypothetical protein